MAGAVGLERCWGKLWISEPCEVGAVELDVFHGDRECVVLRVGGIKRDLCGLMTWKGALSWPMRNETDSWLPPVAGWTAKVASQEAMSLGPSVVYQVGLRSIEPFK